jgi:uncharacterized protein YbjT (DUF2867 family)
MRLASQRCSAECSSEFSVNFGVSLPVQFVATYDIGWFAARALEDPEHHAGRINPLARDELSRPRAWARF